MLPRSVRPARTAENLDVFGFELTEHEMSSTSALDTGACLAFDHRDPNMVSWLHERAVSSPAQAAAS